MTPRRALLAVVLLGAALRLVHFVTILPTVYPRLPEAYDASDMAAFVEWAQEIQAGDWLGRETYHPSFAWSSQLGSSDDWARWWGGREIFHQAPLYPYLLAVLLLGGVPFTLAVQLVLGALQPLVVYRLGRRLGGERAGLIAAALTALYVPFLVHQAVLLRDWLPALLEPLAILLLLEASPQRPRGYVFGGLVLGLAFLTKPTVALIGPALLVWCWIEARGQAPRAARVACWILLGGLLALQPLLIRNQAVGAPLLAVSNRFPEAFIVGNAKGSPPIGYAIPDSYTRLLEEAQGSKLGLVRATLATWEGDWGGFAWHQWLKLRGALGPYEVPNNIDVYYARQRSPVLWLGLGFGGVLAPALLGAWALRRRGRDGALILLWVAAGLLSLTLPNAIGRYRLAFVQAVIVCAGCGLAWLTRRLQAGRGGPPLLGLAAGYVLHLVLLPVDAIWSDMWVVGHPGEYVAATKLYLREGDHQGALAEAERYRERTAPLGRLDPDALRLVQVQLEGLTRVTWARDLLAAGQPEQAREQAHAATAVCAAEQAPAALLLELARVQERLGMTAAARETRARIAALQAAERAGAGR